MKQRRYSANIGFTDILFNVLLGFVFLFIIAFILINPPTKKNDVPAKAEIMVIMEWDGESNDDIDMWLLPGDNDPVSFKKKNIGFWHLDRDDLGQQNDLTKIDGQMVVLKSNREIVTMRGIQPGDVAVNVHVYTKRDKGPTKFTVTLMDVNPYREYFVYEGVAETQNQVFTLPSFTVNTMGAVTEVWRNDFVFATKRNLLEGNLGIGSTRPQTEAAP